MLRLSFQLNVDRPRWWGRLFRCQHEVVRVEENFASRYGTHTYYAYCLKCGRKAGEIERNCKHEVDPFGMCRYCLSRITKHNCEHEWIQEPDTDNYYCDKCGVWKDRII